MELTGLSTGTAKAAKKANQAILADTKYNKEPTLKSDRKAKSSPTIEEIKNGKK